MKDNDWADQIVTLAFAAVILWAIVRIVLAVT